MYSTADPRPAWHIRRTENCETGEEKGGNRSHEGARSPLGGAAARGEAAGGGGASNLAGKWSFQRAMKYGSFVTTCV